MGCLHYSPAFSKYCNINKRVLMCTDAIMFISAKTNLTNCRTHCCLLEGLPPSGEKCFAKIPVQYIFIQLHEQRAFNKTQNHQNI